MGRFFILSEDGSGLGLAMRLQAEGHEVSLKVFDEDYCGLGEGLVDKEHSYIPDACLVAAINNFGDILESWRDQSGRIFAGGVYANKLETDRAFAEEVMHRANIETPESLSVTSWEDAAKEAKRLSKLSGGKVVLKPEGALSGVVPSYVASDEEDALEMLKQFEKRFGSGELQLTVQEFIKGVAVSTEGWFTGSEWAEGMFNHTLEKKSFLAGDIGPSTGCTGNVVWSVSSTSVLVRETLQKLTKTLRKHRYVGPIDINCVVNSEGIYGLEFTPRFGYDAFPTALCALCEFDFGGFISDCASGGTPDAALREGFGAGIRVGMPPWPSEKFKAEPGVVIRGLKAEDYEWFYPYEVQRVDDELQSSKGFGLTGVVNGHGSTISEAFARAYQIAERMKFPDKQYRVDLTSSILKDYRELQSTIGSSSEGWIGVDLDGTLAMHQGWSIEVGEPVPKMVNRVKRWLDDGKEVRVLTARVAPEGQRHSQVVKISEWLREHVGTGLEVTHEKDPSMVRLFDDRVRQVVKNEGTVIK